MTREASGSGTPGGYDPDGTGPGQGQPGAAGPAPGAPAAPGSGDEAGDEAGGWAALFRPGTFGLLCLVSLAVWLHAADSMLMATMISAMVSEIGGAALVSWTVAVYIVGSILSGTASGLLSVRYGIRPVMLAAALVFAAGCAVAALAPGMGVVILGRVLQGLGGGGLMALAYIAAMTLFAPALRPRVIAAISALWGTSTLLGPLVGGLFVEFVSWRFGMWAFGAQALAIALWLLAGLRRAPGRAGAAQTVAPGEGRIPWVRLGILALGVMLVAAGGIAGSAAGTLACVLAGLAALGIFVRRDRAQEAGRMLPRAAFAPGSVAGSGLVMVLALAMGTIGMVAYGPIFLIRLHGLSALEAGYAVASASLAWTVAAMLVAGAGPRSGRVLIGIGVVLATLSVPGLAWSMPRGPVWVILLAGAAEGFGFGMAWSWIMTRVRNHVAPGDAERAAGIVPTAQLLGYALGAALAGIAANRAGFTETAGPEILRHAARDVFLVGLPPALVALAALVVFLRRGRAQG